MGAHAGDGLNFVVAGLHIGDDRLAGELRHVGVGVGVVHHLVAGVVEGLDGLRVFVHPVPHHEEGGLYVVFSKDVDELLGVLVAPGGVKGDGQHLLVPLNAVDGKLPVGGGGLRHCRGVDQGKHGRRQQGARQHGQGPAPQDQTLHTKIRSLLK